jgi:hypothetical protein
MGDREFTRADDVIAFVASHLEGRLSDLPTSANAAAAEQLSSIWSQPIQSVRPPGGRPAHIAALRWVIRDDDLKVLDTVLDGLKASAGAGFFVLTDLKPTAVVVAAVGLLAGVVKLAYNAASKGVVLSPDDYSIISALLKHKDGLTEEQLLEELRPADPGWTPEKTRSELARLAEAPSRSGKIALVWKTPDSKWRTTGL